MYQYLSRKYPKESAAGLNERVKAYLKEEEMFAKYNVSSTSVAETEQFKMVRFAVEYAKRHRALTVILGEPGSGKTQGLQYLAAQNPADLILFTMNVLNGSKTRVIGHMARNLPGFMSSSKSSDILLENICDYLRRKPKVLIFDQSNFLTVEGLLAICAVQDDTEVGVVLSGTAVLDEKLLGDEQIIDRVKWRAVLPAELTKVNITAIVDLFLGDAVGDTKEIVAWIYGRCMKRKRRRYRWIHAILNESYARCVAKGKPLTTEELDRSEVLTGLSEI
jgi:DNA transposition AAA+ family ATPase